MQGGSFLPSPAKDQRYEPLPEGAELTVRRLRSTADLAAIRSEWQSLWIRSPDATPFQSPEWLIPWWQAYGNGRLLCWAIRSCGELVALVPFYMYGKAPHRRVFLLGTGNSDYLDLLCEAGQTLPVVLAIFRLLDTHGDAWDSCEFQQMPPGSALLTRVPEEPLRSEIIQQEICPVLDLSVPAGNGPAAPGEIWRKVAYYRRRAARQGRVESAIAGAADFEEIFAALIDLHRKRLNAKELRSSFDAPRDEAFQRAAARQFLQSGMLRLHVLRIDGRIIAVLYAFHAHRRTYFYLSGLDSEFAGLSPGTLIVAAAIEHARREGAIAFDFMRGREPYKYRWGAVDRPNAMLRLWRHGDS
jgi:CelD/BcsL family acetyltransferase involved in cellulose biosynthesis